MPYSIDIPLKVERRLPEEAGEAPRALKAFFYRCIESAEPRLARFIHTQAEPKPFTVSPLLPADPEGYHLRVTLLEDEYMPYLAAGLKREQTLRAGEHILRVAGEPDATRRSYAELAEAAEHAREITLQFESPTGFRANGLDDPLPVPRRVFQSYLRRWSAFAGIALDVPDAYLDWVEENVAVSRFELRTEVLKFQEHIQIGCVGRVQYQAARRAPGDAPMVRALNRLADYAYYCGTGHKTTEGMGQTRRVGGVNKT